jgi:formimidoylglutamase
MRKKELEKYLSLPDRPLKTRHDPCEINIGELITCWKPGQPAPDMGIIGVPFDTTSIFNRGSSQAPGVIREILYTNRDYNPDYNIALTHDNFRVADFGDLNVVHTDYRETHNRLTKVISELCSDNIIPIVIGGDHGISFPVIRGLVEAKEKTIGVIVFDAHPDLRQNHYGEITSGTPFRRALEEIPGHGILPSNLVEIGIGGWHNSAFYWDFIKERGITVFTNNDVHEKGIRNAVSKAIEVAGFKTDHIYVSLDIDVLDCAYAPGTGAPSPGGLTSRQMLEAMLLLGRENRVIGLDLVEVFPNKDINNITSTLAASLIQTFIAGRISKLRGA